MVGGRTHGWQLKVDATLAARVGWVPRRRDGGPVQSLRRVASRPLQLAHPPRRHLWKKYRFSKKSFKYLCASDQMARDYKPIWQGNCGEFTLASTMTDACGLQGNAWMG